ncbi:gliding motility-associated ABC transporter permease subunit GldF [Aureitalea marina]|uniref:Gliding motility-associated ABC transporter permease subunit GldF n=1 Tax=Aureitalea marina TaxID=930804 RepID=A0A2S7KNU7_9FLAO|nr:gliding motility-associated ABC transporter permease subunit GldF [Aureitalea marina]PQB04258.1 gliding motility-associated ABC transporter permease subunit GldF [Aureitalea marina]
MIAVARREISYFFSSATGYLVIGLFLLTSGLFLWVFPGDYQILDAGFADLGAFFDLAPLLMLILIPGICMRSISEERRMGTLQMLLTRPISTWQLVLGKFTGAFLLMLLALIPTLTYVWTISEMSLIPGNWDLGVVLGSYFGLLFLAAAYTAIGLFCSSLSSNQIVAFLMAVILIFLIYFGLNSLTELSGQEIFSKLGMQSHFDSMSRGVLDSDDLIYFLTVTILFLWMTKISLESKR